MRALVLALLWPFAALAEGERAGDFGPRFIELARSVYLTNDRRAAVKREINELLGSRIQEEKSYAAYQNTPAGPPARQPDSCCKSLSNKDLQLTPETGVNLSRRF